MRWFRRVCRVVAAVLAILGGCSKYVADRAVEGQEGVYLPVGRALYKIPNLGTLGDHGTFCFEFWALGMSGLSAAAALALHSATKPGGLQDVLFVGVVFAALGAALFGGLILVEAWDELPIVRVDRPR